MPSCRIFSQLPSRAGGGDKLLLFEPSHREGPFAEPRGHRAIGVVYDPDAEKWGNYVPTRLPERYDAFIFVDRSRALHPLHLEPKATGEPPDTYPWAT